MTCHWPHCSSMVAGSWGQGSWCKFHLGWWEEKYGEETKQEDQVAKGPQVKGGTEEGT